MRTFEQKQNRSQPKESLELNRSSAEPSTMNLHTHLTPTLQPTIGNQAVQRLMNRCQRQAEHNTQQEDHIHEVANEGIAGPAEPLPYLNGIQQSFGRYDVSGVEAHTGAEATVANQAMDAIGYTMGNHVAFAGAPNLHTAAHEAAHVVQQRQEGFQLKSEMGEPGDAYEQNADAVADLVVQGSRAELLLDQMAGTAVSHGANTAGASVMGKTNQPVQRQQQPKQPPDLHIELLMWKVHQDLIEWGWKDKIKRPIANELAHEYISNTAPSILPMTTPTTTGLAVTTYLEGPTWVPNEERVALAIYRSLDVAKTGKGDKATDWTLKWVDPRGREKMPDDKAKELLLGSGRMLLEEFTTGKIEEILVKWVARGLGATVLWATGIAEIWGALSLFWEVSELLMGLSEPNELSPEQKNDAIIVADVKDYLQKKQLAADIKKSLLNPNFQVPININAQDKTTVYPNYKTKLYPY